MTISPSGGPTIVPVAMGPHGVAMATSSWTSGSLASASSAKIEHNRSAAATNAGCVVSLARSVVSSMRSALLSSLTACLLNCGACSIGAASWS